MGGGEVGAEDAEVVARRAQVVVDDVEAHADAGAVGGVDEAHQGLGAPVCLVNGPQAHPVVAPSGSAGEGGQGHELDDVDALLAWGERAAARLAELDGPQDTATVLAERLAAAAQS